MAHVSIGVQTSEEPPSYETIPVGTIYRHAGGGNLRLKVKRGAGEACSYLRLEFTGGGDPFPDTLFAVFTEAFPDDLVETFGKLNVEVK